jgi:flagellar basal-body rod protein FlgC
MSISSILSSAVSGLVASSARITASAENIANVNTDGYLAHDTQNNSPSGLVSGKAFVPAAVQVAAIEPSNVSIGKEFIDMMAAKAAYKANAAVIRTAEDMLEDSLDIKA